MRIVRKVSVAGCFFGLTLGVMGFVAGCGDDSGTTGTQVKVDQAKEEQHNKQMQEYMQNKMQTKGKTK